MSEKNRVRLDMGEREFDVTAGGALVCDTEKAVIIVMPKTLKPHRSKSGKADLYATTAGAVTVAGGLRVAANMYRSIGKPKDDSKADKIAEQLDNLF